MNVKRIATIALSYRDYESFGEKLEEACRWVSLAGRLGAELAVLPEMLNFWRGDGPNNPNMLTTAEMALDDWQAECKPLLDCALEHEIAVTVPVMIRHGEGCLNCFYLVSRTGEVLGRYAKTYPTQGEQKDGVAGGGAQGLIDWDGLKVGGAICFDLNFRDLFERQAAAGADLFLCPSLFPGGRQVNSYALSFQTPVVIAYPAWSRIIDILGRDIVAGGYRHETLRFGFGVPVYTADVNFDKQVFHFDLNQTKIEDILRRYGSEVAIDFDQDECCFALESLSPDLTVKRIVAEFELRPRGKHLRETREGVES